MKSPITLAAYGAHRGDLVELDPDHPGFRDRIYRKRRNDIAAIALAYRSGDPVPEAPYTEEEHAVWETIWTTLEPLHATLVCRELQECEQNFSMDRTRIPQLWEVNERLKAVTGYRMEPVGGLVAARAFLSRLGRGVFRSTQYIRHHSRPLYTPEPDVVHELVGHAATLAQPSIAALNRCIGKAALVASESEMARIESVYWYTMEFGTVEEGGEVVAIGAGLLSSCGELAQMRDGPELREWNLDAIARTPYDPTDYQPQLFVGPSFSRLMVEVTEWIEMGRWRDAVLA